MAEGFKLLDAYVEVTASGKGLAEKVGNDFASEAPAAARRSSTSFGSSLMSGMKSLGSIGGAGASLFGSAFTGVIGGLVGGVTSTVLGMVGSVVSGAMSMASQLTSIVASTVIDFNSTLQNATIGFTTMLGSGEKSAAFLNKLQDFAKTTPFEFKNLISNAQNMMGMGIAAKDVIPDLRALGDSVASIGGSASQVDSVTLAFDQMNAKGTLDMGNMNQLMQNGVPSALKIMAAAYHVTTGQMIGMISTGKVQADVALPALIKGIEKGTKSTAALGGMMDKQSTTFTGALSNIQDGLTQTVSKAFKPFFDTASKGMQRFATSLSGKPAAKFQKDVTKAIQPLAKQINKWFNSIDIDDVFKQAGDAVKKFGTFLKSKDFKDFVGEMKDIAKSVETATPIVVKAIKDWGPAFLGAIKWVADTTGAFADGASQWKAIFSGFGKWFNDTFVKLPAQIEVIGAQIVAGFVGGITDSWHTVTDTISGLVNAIPIAVRTLLGIHSPSKVFHVIGQQVGEGLHLGLLGSVDQIKTTSAKMADAVRAGFSGSKEKSMLSGLAEVTRELVSTAKSRDKAVDILKAAKDKLKGVLSDRADFKSGVVSGAMGGADVTGLFGASTTTTTAAGTGTLNGNVYTPSWTTSVTAGSGLAGVKAGLKRLLADTKKFASNLKKLVKMGIDPATYGQLVAAGVAGGLEVSTDLVNDPAAFKSIVGLEKQIGKAANSLGSMTANQTYAKQVAAAKTAVARDTRTVNQFNVTMVVEAKKIDEVDKLIKMVSSMSQAKRAAGKKK